MTSTGRPCEESVYWWECWVCGFPYLGSEMRRPRGWQGWQFMNCQSCQGMVLHEGKVAPVMREYNDSPPIPWSPRMYWVCSDCGSATREVRTWDTYDCGQQMMLWCPSCQGPTWHKERAKTGDHDEHQERL